MLDQETLERLQSAFDRIGGVPELSEGLEEFAERVECGDAIRIAYQAGMILAALEEDDRG